jgi:hypothetical protein
MHVQRWSTGRTKHFKSASRGFFPDLSNELTADWSLEYPRNGVSELHSHDISNDLAVASPDDSRARRNSLGIARRSRC